MIVWEKYFKRQNLSSQRGATLTEAVLAVGVVIAVAPFMYNQIVEMSHEAQDIAKANEIVKVRDDVINFVRINQNEWDENIEIKLSDAELKKISPNAHSGYVDKYKVNGSSVTDVYLAFDIDDTNYRIANIARQIGDDAAIVRGDGIAYSQSWAVSSPDDFYDGDLIYRISYNFEGSDKSKFLHRGTMGEDGLNRMERNLHMGNFNLFNIGDINAVSAKIADADAVFFQSDFVDADTVYFSSGANVSSSSINFYSLRVSEDTNGFKLIRADTLNSNTYTTSSRVIADRATVSDSINISGDLILKSSSAKTVSGFGGMSTSRLITPYLSADDIVFFENFGITVSGELLLSGVAPLKIGSWSFPSTTPPHVLFA